MTKNNFQKNTKCKQIQIGSVVLAMLVISGTAVPTQSAFSDDSSEDVMTSINEHHERLFTTNFLQHIVSVYDGDTIQSMDVGKGSSVCIDSNNGLFNPRGITSDDNGTAYVSSFGVNTIIRFDVDTCMLRDDILKPFINRGDLKQPQGMTIREDFLYVANTGTDSVLKYDAITGQFIERFDKGGELVRPEDVKFGPDGNLYVSSGGNNTVLRYDGNTGQFIDVFVNSGNNLVVPGDLVFNPDEAFLVVASTDNNRINRYDAITGQFVNQCDIGTGFGTISVDYGPDGKIYVASWIKNDVVRFDDFDTCQRTTVIDNDGSGMSTILFVSLSDNRPTANAGEDISVREGDSVTPDGSASSDPQNRPLTYQWSQTSGPAVTLSDQSSANPTFTAPPVNAMTVLEFELVVDNGIQTSQPDTVKVTVESKPERDDIYVVKESENITSSDELAIRVYCDDGDYALGGGFETAHNPPNVFKSTPIPSESGATPTGWLVQYRDLDVNFKSPLGAFVVCTSEPGKIGNENDAEIDWADIMNRPAGLDDGDDVGLTFIDWKDIQNIPSDIADGDDVGNDNGTTGVDWTHIQNIPEGFADSLDNDTVLSEMEVDELVSDNGFMTSVSWSDILGIPAEIIDGDDVGLVSVDWNDIQNIPNDIADGDDIGHGANLDVNWTDIMNRPAGLDDGDDTGLTAVHWNDILGIPSGFADGRDDTVTAVENYPIACSYNAPFGRAQCTLICDPNYGITKVVSVGTKSFLDSNKVIVSNQISVSATAQCVRTD